ncbi:bifunctional diaminohydroxyphosphoribosylaminopyrimidine deaminase/5-amino-6-(5-phosphoribosylamino)uracil reductase RibD [Brevibacterium yomogidense]|uniref:bifunctional diaminohydroxyphosphoribosylaminopyrimidine deaminase/5-amino-6-(5-phosphoribosylamino)uracil reductase RibD n=1 Tax=Brevibacterium yomogidense TaxID=946573 RepID=UPI0018DF8725|nr:bifunctional diaminohydroxyphosphoribosylaminopyrimidine deaminase/5-amino-6-(5-phosphoribosylamino)uracil reductase RibD [Brevibacterium yomogidense]
MDRSALSQTITHSSMLAAMDVALVAARRGIRGANPLVGAAVLDADGTLVTGHHRGAGTPHAEADAMSAARAAGIDLTRATVFVTLEPCSHHGRTGPCADLLVDAGVPHVVIAVADPNPAAAGGAARLRAAGTTVTTGVREAEARAVNARWLRAVGERRPYVTLKIAQSLDGRIAAADGTSQWITSPASRARVHALRARVDAVLVGTGTAHADDPRLTARPTPEAVQSPDAGERSAAGTGSQAGAGPEAGADSEAGAGSAPASPLPFTQPVPVAWGMRDLAPGSHLARDPRTVHLRTRDPHEALETLHAQGIQHVLVEGGAHVAGALIRSDLVDELEVHIAPVLLGDGLPGLADLGVTTLSEAVRWLPDDTTGDALLTEACVPSAPSSDADIHSAPSSDADAHSAGTATSPPASQDARNPDTLLRFIPDTRHSHPTAHTKDS